jgi:hypothetical protein
MSRAAHRLLVATLCILLIVGGWLIVETAPDRSARKATPRHWVRTSQGWRRSDWNEPAIAPEPRLHPWLIAAFVSMASATALLSFPARSGPPKPPSER